jgi:hypothetical protein
MNLGCWINLGCIRNLSGIYPGYIPDESISQMNLGYILNISQNISQIYLGYILRLIWDSKAGGKMHVTIDIMQGVMTTDVA